MSVPISQAYTVASYVIGQKLKGHKRYPLPKLEIWRRENGKPLLHPEDEHIVAIASDTVLETKLQQFDLNDHEGIGNFILSYNGFR